MKINLNKQKLFEIFLTALVSALIAVLQNILLGIGVDHNTGETTIVAGIVGGTIRACRA
jgi:ABC-type phosphate/phosphonate transport system permease subunit